LALKKDRILRLRKQTVRNAKLHLKEVERRDKSQEANENIQREVYFRIESDKNLIEREREQILLMMTAILPISPKPPGQLIRVPAQFSLEKNYEESMRTVQNFASALFYQMGVGVELDFSSCVSADASALFFMRVIQLHITENIEDLQSRLALLKVIPRVHYTPSRKKDVNRLLVSTGYLSREEVPGLQDNDLSFAPVDDIGYLKGVKAQKHYQENRKPAFAKRIADYIDDCLGKHGYSFSVEFKNMFEGIIAEVLSNAEDHTSYPHWYITASFAQEDFNAAPHIIVGEINLNILNFGHSIYEGFLETKEENHGMFSEVVTYIEGLRNNYPSMRFTDEQLFTMALLQDQMSRLKYKDESRGTGTVKFITSFLDIGDYYSKEKGYTPKLSIFSGNTHVCFDHTIQPFSNDGVICIALNAQQDLKRPPETQYLRKLVQRFPGTLFSVKVYINRDHFDKKYGGSTNENGI